MYVYVSSAAGFDGYAYLYVAVTSSQLLDCMARVKRSETNPGLVTGKVNSLLEGVYDTSPTLGLAKCVDAHVQALRDVDGWMDRWMDG